MWDPYLDLLSGKASPVRVQPGLEIPLYLHINIGHDSSTMLAFWWYASCCRHLGIGGLDEKDEQWPRLVEAMQIYRRLQPWFAWGQFIWPRPPHPPARPRGPDRSAVLTAYNLGSEEGKRSVTVDLSVLGLNAAPEVASSPPTALAAQSTDKGTLVLDLQIAPLSPLIVEIGTGNLCERET